MIDSLGGQTYSTPDSFSVTFTQAAAVSSGLNISNTVANTVEVFLESSFNRFTVQGQIMQPNQIDFYSVPSGVYTLFVQI